MLGHDIYTTFQNGVGPQGEPSSDGNTDSTIVEFTLGGRVVRQWDLRGKCDGLTADTAKHLRHRHDQRGRELQRRHDHAGRGARAPGPALPLQRSRFRTTEAPTPSRSGTAKC